MMNLLDGSDIENLNPRSTTSDQTEYRGKSSERNIKRSNSLMVSRDPADKIDYRTTRRSVSLFEDEDKSLPPLPRHVMTLGRKYRDSGKSNNCSMKRENFHNYRNDKIQEETFDESKTPNIKIDHVDDGFEQTSEGNSVSSLNTNFVDTASSVSARSSETSPNESTSNMMDFTYSCKSDPSKDFENRLLAAENLIKESKLRNLGPSSFDVNLNSSYRDTDKCNKESLDSISESGSGDRRRSYIPSLRLRSGSLTREPVESRTRRRSFTGSQDAVVARAPTPERSILSKFFKSGSSKDEKNPKPTGQRRISRFLRPDFFDTPREESQYVKDKEAQKAAENERRKSRFSKKKNSESKESKSESKPPKELKNEANSITKEQSEISSKDDKTDRDVSSISEDPKPRFERGTTKNSFLHSLEKKLEKFRSGDDASKAVVNSGNLIEQKIRSLRESSAPPEELPLTESSLIKRAVSVEDLPLYNTISNPTKGKVSSVLGLFKNIDTKSSPNGQRPQSMLFSKLRKNSYKGSRSDSMTDGEIASTSKIPMKVEKASRKKSEEVKLSGKTIKTESKKSPPKFTTDGARDTARSSLPDKINKEVKKSSPEKDVEKRKDSLINKAKVSPDKSEITSVSSDKVTDSSNETDGKKAEKVRKSSVPSLAKNGSVKSVEKVNDAEKKVKKTTAKVKESNDKEADGTKKKRIVRVVKKVVKKSSDSSESKSEGKEKPRKLVNKKVSSSSNDANSDVQISNGIDKPQEANAKLKTVNNIGKIDANTTIVSNNNSNEVSTEDEKSKSNEGSKMDENKSNGIKTTENNVDRGKASESRSNRNSLKLDLSKIPQHTFRSPQIPKKESTQLELPKTDAELPKLSINKAVSNSPEDAKKLIQNLSKITHHANDVTENNIEEKDMAELSKEFKDSCNIVKENGAAQSSRDPNEAEEGDGRLEKVVTNATNSPNHQKSGVDEAKANLNLNLPVFNPNPVPPPKESPNEEIFSPTDDTESFDSWSICSADMNQSRSELPSPTSPTASPSCRSGDQQESIVDRIRRRSFYSRFNDRKRKTSLNAPPPGVSLPVGSTLPRKYSFNRDQDRLSSYTSPTKRYPEKSYSLYTDEVQPYRRSPIDRDRYSDLGSASSYNSDLRSPKEQYGSSLTSPYDPLRKFTRSPTLESSSVRRKYYNSDYGVDNDLSSYRSPLSGSLTNDNPLECYSKRNFNTLPRKYGSTEPKTADYYEELLAPNNSNYLTSRKTPIRGDSLTSRENGYHNGNSESEQFKAEKWKTAETDKTAGLGTTEVNNGRLGDQIRYEYNDQIHLSVINYLHYLQRQEPEHKRIQGSAIARLRTPARYFRSMRHLVFFKSSLAF